jgi:hypothetical protein
MPLDPNELNDLRRRVLENKPWTEEELAAAIKARVADRIANLETPKPKGRATKKTTADLSDLLE